MQQFRRDKNSQALINSDPSATKAYKLRREQAKKLQHDINTLTSKVKDLESMIQQLLRGQHDIS